VTRLHETRHGSLGPRRSETLSPTRQAHRRVPSALGGLALAAVFAVLLAAAPGAGALAGGAFEISPDLALPVVHVLEDAAPGDPASGNVMRLAQTVVTQGQRSVAKEKKAGEGYKSPGKAFIFSAVAPGSGQLYVGAKRGYVYLGIEAVAWTTSYFFHQSGKEKEDEYMDFADVHWTEPALGDSVGLAPDGVTVIRYDEEHHERIEYFYQNDKGHYYEDIGKYAYYTIGWDTGTLDDYLDMRDDSNRLLKNSDYAIMAAVVNHVVSAVDALRLARSHNLNLGHGVKLNLKLKGGLHSSGVMVVASRKF